MYSKREIVYYSIGKIFKLFIVEEELLKEI